MAQLLPTAVMRLAECGVLLFAGYSLRRAGLLSKTDGAVSDIHICKRACLLLGLRLVVRGVGVCVISPSQLAHVPVPSMEACVHFDTHRCMELLKQVLNQTSQPLEA